jgi:RNA polymerase sigma factor (sigma-70 family)
MSESRSDIELLREFAERASESAFEALVQRHADLVFATAMRRVGQEAVAQEITQDVFIALARKAAWLGDGSSLAGWLYKATLHKANHWWRGEMRRRQRENTAAELNTTMKDDQAPLNAMQTVLDDGLLTLGEGERQALLLRFLERYSHREIGTILGIGEDAARKRVDRGVTRLTDFFRQRGLAVGSTALVVSALESAAGNAPLGLVGQVTHAAFAQTRRGLLNWVVDRLGRFLYPSRVQTVTLCTALILGPGLWQGARWFSAIQEQHRIEGLFTALKQERDSITKERMRTERELRRVSNRLTQLQVMTKYSTSLTEANLDPRLFHWDESTDYVRVSKSALRWLSFKNPDQEEERTLNTYGAPISPTLLGALGLDSKQQDRVQAFCQMQIQNYLSAARARSYLTHFASLGPGHEYITLNENSRAWVTPALAPEESARWTRLFENGLSSLIGAERTQILLRNANDDSSLSTCLQRFGSEDCAIMVTPFPNGECQVCRQSRFRDGKPRWYCTRTIPISAAVSPLLPQPPGSSAAMAEVELWHALKGLSLPAELTDYLAQWTAAHSGPSEQPLTR